MRILLLAILLTSSALGADTPPGNVLKNGDFSEGLTHWDGDCRPLSMVTNQVSPNNGAGVELLGTWTKLTQNFDTKKGHYVLSVTFTITPDTTFVKEEKEYRKIPAKLGFSDLKEFHLKRGEWCIIVTNLAARRYEYCGVKPLKDDSSVQTMTGEIDLKSDSNGDTFCLAFPPGHGFVTLQSVSMVQK
jgi:hypothetical protein